MPASSKGTAGRAPSVTTAESPAEAFPRRYTLQDVVHLTEVDEAFGDAHFERLVSLSNSPPMAAGLAILGSKDDSYDTCRVYTPLPHD